MSILSLHEGQAAAAAPEYIALPKPEPKFNAWGVATAVPRGMAEAGMQVLGSVADIGAGLAYYRDTPTKDMQAGIPAEAFSSDLGDSLRARGREFRPDPLTASAAEELLYGFARGASKIVGGALAAGPAGVVAAGAEEGMTQSDELRRQGVGLEARNKAGMVQGAGLGLAALPLVGQTLKATAGLYVAGGPGGFMAQQALTREILRNAGQDQIAAQFDPFDPVGLAVASLIPAGFAAWGIRGQRMAAAAKAAEDFRTGPVPSEVSPVADAVRQAYSPEVVDAARVVFATEQRAASNLGDSTVHADAHEAALSKAEDQMARGEPVQVADVAPSLTPEQRAANFKAWFGDSKVVDALGKPMVMYHGTGDSFDAFDATKVGANFGDKAGFYFTNNTAHDVANTGRGVQVWDDSAAAGAYARGEAPNIMPVYLQAKNPKVIEGDSGGAGVLSLVETRSQSMGSALELAAAEGHDALIVRDSSSLHNGEPETVVAVLNSEQIKSAIGNSGRYDPSSASLTDPLPAFADAIDQLRAARSPEPARAAEPTKAANPEATAPRSDAAAPAGVPGARPAAAEAAGLTPGASAETAAAAARIEGIRAQHPDLMVQIDGMDAPMRMDDFLKAVKAEADEMAADAPLMEVAAQCALLNGP